MSSTQNHLVMVLLILPCDANCSRSNRYLFEVWRCWCMYFMLGIVRNKKRGSVWGTLAQSQVRGRTRETAAVLSSAHTCAQGSGVCSPAPLAVPGPCLQPSSLDLTHRLELGEKLHPHFLCHCFTEVWWLSKRVSFTPFWNSRCT